MSDSLENLISLNAASAKSQPKNRDGTFASSAGGGGSAAKPKTVGGHEWENNSQGRRKSLRAETETHYANVHSAYSGGGYIYAVSHKDTRYRVTSGKTRTLSEAQEKAGKSLTNATAKNSGGKLKPRKRIISGSLYD